MQRKLTLRSDDNVEYGMLDLKKDKKKMFGLKKPTN
jgi:hypothetical protein